MSMCFFREHKLCNYFFSRIKNCFPPVIFYVQISRKYVLWKLIPPKSVNALDSFGSLHFLASQKADSLERQLKYDIYLSFNLVFPFNFF